MEATDVWLIAAVIVLLLNVTGSNWTKSGNHLLLSRVITSINRLLIKLIEPEPIPVNKGGWVHE